MAALRLARDVIDDTAERQRLGLRRDLRLRKRSDFDAVYRRGRIFNDPLLVLRTLPNDLEHNRYGFVTSGKLGGAVVRNRVRRRLREIVRLAGTEMTPPNMQTSKQANSEGHGSGSGPRMGYDIVLSAKVAAVAASYQDLEGSVRRLYEKGGLAS